MPSAYFDGRYPIGTEPDRIGVSADGLSHLPSFDVRFGRRPCATGAHAPGGAAMTALAITSAKGATMAGEPIIHRYPKPEQGAFVNAYLVETESSVVAIDSLLAVSETRAMRAGLERLGKPLRAVLLTHSH